MSRRPSHEALMAAQEALGSAREQEKAAGNLATSRYLNDLCLTVFRVAIDDEIDAELSGAYEAADRAAGR